jgi:hypothetical protein
MAYLVSSQSTVKLHTCGGCDLLAFDIAMQNFDRTFTHPNCSIAAKYPKFQQLEGLAQQHDPAGMFKGSLVEKVFSRTSYELTPGCR